MPSSSAGMSKADFYLAHNASAATADTLDSVATELDPAHPHFVGPGCSKMNKTEGAQTRLGHC
jgi:hypothetical protein